MKLTSDHVEQTLQQMNATVLPEAHPVTNALCGLFGEHTFFLDADGVCIVEKGGDEDAAEVEVGRVMKIAKWSDDDHSMITPHPAVSTGTVVALSAHS